MPGETTPDYHQLRALLLRPHVKSQLSYEEGLVVAIIHRATLDIAFCRPYSEHWLSAWDYFHSEEYRDHLRFLGLPQDIHPTILDHFRPPTRDKH